MSTETTTSEMCLHCESNLRQTNKRGLCLSCYKNTEIRKLYPTRNGSGEYHEMTMAELDAMIAERYPTMPREGPRTKDGARTSRGAGEKARKRRKGTGKKLEE